MSLSEDLKAKTDNQVRLQMWQQKFTARMLFVVGISLPAVHICLVITGSQLPIAAVTLYLIALIMLIMGVVAYERYDVSKKELAHRERVSLEEKSRGKHEDA